MKIKAPKQPRALRLADEIVKKDCTKTNKENAASELRRLYMLNKMSNEQMNKSWTLMSHAQTQILHSMNELGSAISKSRDSL